MKETEWAAMVANKLDTELQLFDSCLRVVTGFKLTYANEIKEYAEGEPVSSSMKYETDILVFDTKNGLIHKPRVVIETKIKSVTTHDAITYSQKASAHKFVHPYLRYGIFIGKREQNPLPGRLFRHGAHFDFMLSWQGFEASADEWQSLLSIVKEEVTASRKLEEMIFNSRSKDRKHYTILHKPLIAKQV